MKRLLLLAAVMLAFAVYWLTGATAQQQPTPCALCDVDQNGRVDAIDIGIVRSAFNFNLPTPYPTPVPGTLNCALSFNGTTSSLQGSNWPQDYQGAEVYWQGSFGEQFSSAVISPSGQLSASITGMATFSGVVNLSGQGYACTDN